MWMWIIKTEHGYMLEDGEGNLVNFFDMACNCKAHCMELGVETLYLTKKSDPDTHHAYEYLTGKTLWWNR